MHIESLELVGYRRMMLNNIHKLIYTPTSPYQLILGTNGSGKSSLLAELTPLPADSSDYVKQGSKRIKLTHGGYSYILTSTFKSGSKHSFIKDEEELNPGGTATVQKELVRKEFGIWNELHNVLTGRLRFTEMSPQKRRDWITTLSATDYSYALGKFQQLKNATRDRQAVVKHLKGRLTQESSNLSLLGFSEDIETQRRQLVDELNALLAERVPNAASFKESLERIDISLDKIVELNRLSQKYFRLPIRQTFKTVEQIDSALNEITNAAISARDILTHYSTEYAELESTMKKFSSDELEAPVNLVEEIERLEDELIRLREVEFFFQPIDNAQQAHIDTLNIFDDLVSLFKQLPDNSDRHLTKHEAELANAKRLEVQRTLDLSTTAMVKIQRHITLMKEAQENECPSCRYRWRPGFSEEELLRNEQWLLEHQQVVDASERTLKELATFFTKIEDYASKCQYYRGFTNSYPRLKLLWDHILENKLLTDKPAEQTQVFFNWLRDVEGYSKIQQNETRLQQLHRILEQQQLGGTVALMERVAKLKNEIETLTGEISILSDRRKELTDYRDDIRKFFDVNEELNRTKESLVSEWQVALTSYRNRLIDEVVGQHQLDLAQIQQKISNHSTLSGIVTDLEKNLDTSSKEYEAFSLLTRALSPIDGLLAEQMSGFIGCFVDQLNSVIQSIWEYDLNVLPCSSESGELTYQFAAMVGNELRIDDVRDGSTAQQEVVNFAFMLTVMLYLNLKDYPLYLDELGSGFDEQHRINVMQFVKQMMDNKHYSQLFMISHYVSSWGVFLGAQHLVLDATNIAVPDGYNQHVILK